jgi:hypothetical protein
MDANRVRTSARYSVDGTREADNMDETNSKDDGQYIRLRYSTQFTTGGRTHTIEMEVPVPVGASAELREQLIREAEAGMEQLYRRVEAHVRGQRPPENNQRAPSQIQSPAQPAPSSQQPQVQPSRPASSEQRPPMPSAPAASPVSPASTPAAVSAHVREGPQAIPLRDRRAASPAAQPSQPAPSPARPGGSPELPAIPGIASTGSGTMKLIEFLQIIRENWGLSAKQAMDLLQVKSLNNMNYRDLLRQLEPLVEQASANASNTASTPGASGSPAQANRSAPAPSASSASPAPGGASGLVRSTERTPGSSAPSSSRPATPPREQSASPRSAVPQASPAPQSARSSPSAVPQRSPAKPASDLAGPPNIPVIPLRGGALREPGRVYKFDEEDDENGEQEELDVEAANGAYAPEEDNSMSVAMARIKIDELREKNGPSSVNPGRLLVLHNVLGTQISDEQFQQLIERLWNCSSEKKLKQDQVEALISWAKEDYFEDEVSAVLAVLRDQS